ncbi:MAG: TIGR01777 family oxidoreductase [Acidobacteriota bacterium]
MDSLRISLTGATGLIGGRLLVRLQEAGARIRVVGRRPVGGGEFCSWDLLGPEPDPACWEGAEAVVHLAGEPIAGRLWTRAVRDRIRRSRVEGTRNLVESLRRCRVRPRILVAASAVGYYGSRGEELLDEAAPPGTGFLAEVCRAWEAAAAEAAELGIRVVHLRIGIVLAREGGFLPSLLPLFRRGLGARLGDGKQFLPWIHIRDLVNLVLTVLRDERYSGAVSAVAPNPVTNAEFTRCLSRLLRRPALLRVPKTLLRLAGPMGRELLLAGQRAVPAKALSLGFRFEFPELEPALRELLQEEA